MFDLLYGAGMWIAVCLAIAGMAFRCIRLVGLSRLIKRTDISGNKTLYSKSVPEGKEYTIFKRIYINLRESVLSKYPVFTSITIIFHILVVVLPFCIKGHGVLFFHSWRLSLISFSEATGDVLTVIVIALLLVIVLRRIGLPYVRVLTTWKDISALVLTSFPFITGFLAYHRVGNYELMIAIHILSGQLLLVSLGWGKMGHMVFMLFSRFFIRGEYTLTNASRVWGH